MTQPLNLTKTCLVLDCFALAYRAYYGLPSSVRTRSGQAINAVLGFYNTIFSLIEQFRPDYTVVASDDPEPTFRHNLYSEYKAQRPPMPRGPKKPASFNQGSHCWSGASPPASTRLRGG